MTLPLAIILGWLILTAAVGVLAGLNRKFGLEEFMVGGRSFGTVLFYTIAAAEIYSAFAFLGMAGWAFQKGLSVTYGIAYMGIAYGLLFFIGPRIQRLGRRAGYVTQPDFFEDRFGSRPLAVTMAIIGVIFIVPYLQLQLLGAGIIVQIASGGAMSREAAIVAAVVALIVFVTVSGLRGIGWTNLMQALVMLIGMVSVGILVPDRFFGGLDAAFASLERLRPDHLNLPDAGGLGLGWYASAVLLSALGGWAWPHIFAATYSAKSEHVVRRNAGILPLYQLAVIPVIIVGLTCAAKAAEDAGFAAAISHPDHAMLVGAQRAPEGIRTRSGRHQDSVDRPSVGGPGRHRGRPAGAGGAGHAGQPAADRLLGDRPVRPRDLPRDVLPPRDSGGGQRRAGHRSSGGGGGPTGRLAAAVGSSPRLRRVGAELRGCVWSECIHEAYRKGTNRAV